MITSYDSVGSRVMRKPNVSFRKVRYDVLSLNEECVAR